MPEYLTQEQAFMKCKKEGRFIFLEDVDEGKIRTTLLIAEADIQSADSIKKIIQKQSNQWNTVYKLYYDALHELTESFLSLRK
jgi:hypothetical protein